MSFSSLKVDNGFLEFLKGFHNFFKNLMQRIKSGKLMKILRVLNIHFAKDEKRF